MKEITFGRLNTIKVIVQFVVLSAISSYLFYLDSNRTHFGVEFYIWVSLIILIFFIFWYIGPTINSFKVIQRLINDTTEYSILFLFDSGYSIGLKNEKNWFFFTTPYIEAIISELPVKIYFTPSSKNSWSDLSFNFQTLTKENSKRIFWERILFKMYLQKRLKKDIKPEVLNFISELKAKGFSSPLV